MLYSGVNLYQLIHEKKKLFDESTEHIQSASHDLHFV